MTGGCGGVGVGGVATGCGATDGCVVATGVAMGCWIGAAGWAIGLGVVGFNGGAVVMG